MPGLGACTPQQPAHRGLDWGLCAYHGPKLLARCCHSAGVSVES